MSQSKSLVVPLIVAMCVGFFVAACARGGSNGPEARLGSDYGSGSGRNGARRGSAEPGSTEEFKAGGSDTVYFSSDRTDLTPEAQQALTAQVRWLQQHRNHAISIEGHADERGTREYNIALGARRATSVKEFLTQQGIASARIRTTSFGKERPVAVCNDISCWSQNRRAQTVLSAVAISRN